MFGHMLCHALSFHSQTITHPITNNLLQSKQLLRSLNNGCELLPIVMRPDLTLLHYSADNPYTESEFLKICEDYGVPKDPVRYRDEKFYWTYLCGIGWPNDYIGPDSMTRWIIETSVGFTDVGLLRISESVRAYAFLILSSQASARSSIVGNTASVLTAQSAFLNNFEDIVNRKVDVREDIKRYQDTLSYASSKVNYSVGEHRYMLSSDMTLKIRPGTVRYNNKILVSCCGHTTEIMVNIKD